MADNDYMPEPDPVRGQRADREWEDDYDDPDDGYRPRGRDVKYDEDGNEITSNDTLLALFSHLGMIFAGFLVPLILFLVCRKTSPFAARHAKAALNYAITYLLVLFGWYALAALLGLVVYLASQNGMAGVVTGYILAILGAVAAWIGTIVCIVMGAIAAATAKPYRYPVCITFIG